MNKRRCPRPIGAMLLGFGCLAVWTSNAAAQVPVTSLGLGAPVPPTDGRAAALGGSGLGLLGGSLMLRNPADLTAFRTTVIGISLNPESVSLVTAGGEDNTKRSRISLMQAVIPIGDWVFGLGLRSELDQDFLVVFPDTLRASFGDFAFEERREHDGGIGSLDLTLARQLGPVSVGVGAGPVFGTLRQSVSRRFEPDPTGLIATFTPVDDVANWGYASSRVRGGLAFESPGKLRLSGMFGWTAGLEAEQQETGETRDFVMPIEVAFGGSAQVSPSLLIAGSAGWMQWSRAKRDFRDVGVASVFWAGGGIELNRLKLGSAPVPVRVGYRFTDLPFYPRGRSQASEKAFSLGVGLEAARGRAVFELAAEFGSRGDAAESGFKETFSRTALTISIRAP